MKWYVLHTKPRCEKKAEEQLSSIGINTYYPTRSEIKIWSDRKKRVDLPVLPSMILVNIDDKDINKVFECPLIIRYMFWLGKRAVVKQKEIDILKKYLNGSYNLANEKRSELKLGDYYKLRSFNNENGIISKVSNNNLWIYLKSIGCNVKLKLA